MSGRNKVESDKISEKFVEIIKAELDKRGLSAYAFAKILDVRQQTVQQILRHPGRVQSNTIVTWFAALDLEPDLLARKKKKSG